MGVGVIVNAGVGASAGLRWCGGLWVVSVSLWFTVAPLRNIYIGSTL